MLAGLAGTWILALILIFADPASPASDGSPAGIVGTLGVILGFGVAAIVAVLDSSSEFTQNRPMAGSAPDPRSSVLAALTIRP